jgi:hypothetical protein
MPRIDLKISSGPHAQDAACRLSPRTESHAAPKLQSTARKVSVTSLRRLKDADPGCRPADCWRAGPGSHEADGEGRREAGAESGRQRRVETA